MVAYSVYGYRTYTVLHLLSFSSGWPRAEFYCKHGNIDAKKATKSCGGLQKKSE
jgi:hypothetical protein